MKELTQNDLYELRARALEAVTYNYVFALADEYVAALGGGEAPEGVPPNSAAHVLALVTSAISGEPILLQCRGPSEKSKAKAKAEELPPPPPVENVTPLPPPPVEEILPPPPPPPEDIPAIPPIVEPSAESLIMPELEMAPPPPPPPAEPVEEAWDDVEVEEEEVDVHAAAEGEKPAEGQEKPKAKKKKAKKH